MRKYQQDPINTARHQRMSNNPSKYLVRQSKEVPFKAITTTPVGGIADAAPVFAPIITATTLMAIRCSTRKRTGPADPDNKEPTDQHNASDECNPLLRPASGKNHTAFNRTTQVQCYGAG